MRIKRAEQLSKKFADFLGDSVKIEHSTWTHYVKWGKANGIPETEICLSYFVFGKCNQKVFKDLDEVEIFINDYMVKTKSRKILFRRFNNAI